jgi:hypothetical protein
VLSGVCGRRRAATVAVSTKAGQVGIGQHAGAQTGGSEHLGGHCHLALQGARVAVVTAHHREDIAAERGQRGQQGCVVEAHCHVKSRRDPSGHGDVRRPGRGHAAPSDHELERQFEAADQARHDVDACRLGGRLQGGQIERVEGDGGDRGGCTHIGQPRPV